MNGSGAVVTYAQLERRSRRVALVLRAAGLSPGDHVAFQVGNRPEFFDLLWGAHRAGLHYTAISTRLGPDETAYIVEDSGAKAFIADASVAAMPGGLATRPLPTVALRLCLGGRGARWPDYDEILASVVDADLDETVTGDDMLYSSGTTGRPKGIERPLSGRAPDEPDNLTLLTQLAWGFDDSMRYLSPAPLYHAAPLRFCRSAQRVGATVVVMEHFEPEAFLAAVEAHRITHTQVVPTMFVRLLKLPPDVRGRYDISSLRTVIHAAAPCPVPIKHQMIDWFGPIIHEYYAGSEGNGLVLCTSSEWLAHPGTVGRPINATVHIVAPSGDELPPRSAGAIYFESEATFTYHNDPEKTAAARLDNGWTTLGDIGYLDEEGYLFLTDRQANMIISGGVNIYPQEAEDVLAVHPKVGDAAVFGIPNEEWGEEVKAVVQPLAWSDAGPDLEAELLAFCRAQLADYKCPRTVDFCQELPRHPTGKLYKRLLRDPYWAGKETSIG